MKKLLLSIGLIASTILTNAQTITPVAGVSYSGYSGDGGPATTASISASGGLAFDPSGNLFFADNIHHVIRKINTNGIITTVVGNGTAGSSGDGGPAISAQLNEPQNIAFDAAGNLYIKEPKNGKIRKVDVLGNISTYATIAVNPLRAQAMAIDGSGNLFINNDNDVVVEKINTSTVTSIYAGMLGTQGWSGDGGPATAAVLWQAYYLATDVNGNLFISEFQSNTIRKVNSAGIISTVAGTFNSSGTQGIGGMVGDGGPATSAYLATPQCMAVNNAGELYFVTDYGKLRYINNAGIINTLSLGSIMDFYGAESMVFDSFNNLYYSTGSKIKKISNLPVLAGLYEKSSNKINFSLYPNPTSSVINIELLDINNNPTTVSITNILGEEVLKTTETSNKFTVKTNHLKSGVYFVTLANGAKTATKKIIIN